VSVTLTAPEAASTSATLIRFPFPLEKTRLVSSLTLCAPGTEFTGPSFTALTVIATESLSLLRPARTGCSLIVGGDLNGGAGAVVVRGGQEGQTVQGGVDVRHRPGEVIVASALPSPTLKLKPVRAI